MPDRTQLLSRGGLETDVSSDAFGTGPMALPAPLAPKSAQLLGYTSSMMELPRVVVAFHGSRHLRAAMANYGRDVVEDIAYTEDWWLASDSLIPSAPSSRDASEEPTQVNEKEIDALSDSSDDEQPQVQETGGSQLRSIELSDNEDTSSDEETNKVDVDGSLLKSLKVQFQILSAFLDNRTGQKLATTSALETLLARGNGHTELGKVPGLLTSLPFFNPLTESEVVFGQGERVQFTTVDVEFSESLDETFKTIVRDDGALISRAAPVLIGVYNTLSSLPEETLYLDQYTVKAAPETQSYMQARQKFEETKTKVGHYEKQHAYLPALGAVEQYLRREDDEASLGAAKELVELSSALQQHSTQLADSLLNLETDLAKLEQNIYDKHPGGRYDLVSLVCGTKGFVRRPDPDAASGWRWFQLHPRAGEYDDPVPLDDFETVSELVEWSKSGITVYERAEPEEYNGELAPSVAKFCARDIEAHRRRKAAKPVESRALSIEPEASSRADSMGSEQGAIALSDNHDSHHQEYAEDEPAPSNGPIALGHDYEERSESLIDL